MKSCTLIRSFWAAIFALAIFGTSGLVASSASAGEPMRLTAPEMDRITAGALTFQSWNVGGVMLLAGWGTGKPATVIMTPLAGGASLYISQSSNDGSGTAAFAAIYVP